MIEPKRQMGGLDPGGVHGLGPHGDPDRVIGDIDRQDTGLEIGIRGRRHAGKATAPAP